MFVVNRKTGESIQIGKDIRVKIIKTGSGRVRIGIDAPESMKIERKEIDCQNQEEGKG